MKVLFQLQMVVEKAAVKKAILEKDHPADNHHQKFHLIVISQKLQAEAQLIKKLLEDLQVVGAEMRRKTKTNKKRKLKKL